MTEQTAYDHLTEIFNRLNALREACGQLHWDRATIMPDGGSDARTEQIAALDLVCHQLLTAPKTGDLLASAQQAQQDLSDWQQANLALMQREYDHATALSEDLVTAQTRANAQCEMIWREARAENNFQKVAPALSEVLSLTREAAQAKAEKLGVTPYDALLDLYEPGAKLARIEPIFDQYAAFLPDFLEKVLANQAQKSAILVQKDPISQADQEKLARHLMTKIGFSFTHGRLDTSLHPFCGGIPEDVRITTRYNEHDLGNGLMGILHETGHAMYERGLPADWRRQPVGAARGMALHESQSLLVEMQMCRGQAFQTFLSQQISDILGLGGDIWSADMLWRRQTAVARSFIRVDADEVTYPAHVILRTRLEKALIAGDMQIADVPEAWNTQFETLLGVRPPSDQEGCLQDIHWFDGAFGYFPTYTLGAFTAAQFYQAAAQQLPELDAQIKAGEFAPLMTWLGTHIHRQAARYSTDDLLEKVTGSPLSSDAFISHLQSRYLS